MENGLIVRAKEYLKDYRNKKRIFSVFLVMAVIVVFCTVYALILPAITLTTSPDEDAGIESVDSWKKFTLNAELKGDWGEDALKIAKGQLEYKENALNYVEDESGGKNGYTRYGAWCGDAYGDWNEAFALFCIHFAEIPDDALFYSEDWVTWRKTLRQKGLYESSFTASPKIGDIVFIDSDGDEEADRLGFLKEYIKDDKGIRITVIEGDVNGVVGYSQYVYDANNTVVGYIYMEKAQELYKKENPEYKAEEAVSGEAVSGEDCSDFVLPEDVSEYSEPEYEGESAVFGYNDENYNMRFFVTPKKAEDESVLADAEVVVTPRESNEAAVAAEIEESSDASSYNMDSYDIKFTENGRELDFDAYDVVAEIEPKSPVIEAFDADFENEAVNEAEKAVLLAALDSDNTTPDSDNSITLSLDDVGHSVLVVPLSNAGIMLYSSMANPHFTVQYYAWIDTVVTEKPKNSAGSLKVIDTKNGNLPKNGGTIAGREIYVENAGSGKFRVASSNVLTQMYLDRSYEYIKAPNLSYFNRLYLNDHYEIAEIWILNKGADPKSMNEDDWTVYVNPDGIHFTNRPAVAESMDYLLIEEDTVIRIVYNSSEGGFGDAADFYDYDVSTGVWYKSDSLNGNDIFTSQPTDFSTSIYAYTLKSGINSDKNYSGTGAKLAFGNANIKMGLEDEIWLNNGISNKINLYNKLNATASQGCTFGIAHSLVNGKVQYSDGIIAPPLFNEDISDADVPGKTSYDNGEYTLQFERAGDTYTFDAVLGTSVRDLEYFVHPKTGDKTYTHIWTNNYWPMDSAPSYGTLGHDFKHGDYTRESLRRAIGSTAAKYPPSDDGLDHNAYFGMHYSLEFKLDEDYIGPLEYFFYGDDDMWVFLDDTLICDIGGVHSSVGEHVNLWDFLPKGSSGKHNLTFFYMERGAAGSTCYMRFTLPSVSAATVSQSTGQLRIEKEIFGLKDDREYEFVISFFDEYGDPLLDDYSYTKFSKDGEIIKDDILVHDGAKFTLKGDEYIFIKYLPIGTQFTVTEKEGDDYKAVIQIDDGEKMETNTASGEITDTVADVTVCFTNMVTFRLPSTGGIGTYAVTISGFVIMTAAVVCGYAYRRRRERRQS